MIKTSNNIDSIFNQVRSGKKGRDEIIRMLYFDEELRLKVRSTIKKFGGVDYDFDGIFNTSLMQFVKSVVKNKDLRINGTLSAYICGIAKYTWLNERKSNQSYRFQEFEGQDNLSEDITPESLLISDANSSILDDLLGKLGKNCKEVLMLWANSYSMKEIAEIMNYKSHNMAKKKKCKCFKQLLDYLEANPHVKNVLR